MLQIDKLNEGRISKDDFFALIEITKGSKMKYELDKHSGYIMLDRVLYTSTHYPANYGLIPRTLSADGDHLDVLVLCSEPIISNCLVRCYPIGMIAMIDQDFLDEKIIAIPYGDPEYNGYKSIQELPKHKIDEMVHFFNVYKQLEGKKTAVQMIEDVAKAKEVITRCMAEFDKI